jgi:hypothetical protein
MVNGILVILYSLLFLGNQIKNIIKRAKTKSYDRKNKENLVT